jgi:hypothetical protein
MAEQRTLVNRFRASEDMDSSLRGMDQYFSEGEYGELVFKVNKDKAREVGREYVEDDAKYLSAQLESLGMVPWDDHDLVELDWSSMVFRIRFVQTETPSRMYQTPSYVAGAIIAARGVAIGAPILARTPLWRAIILAFGKIGSKLFKIGGGLTRTSAFTLIGTGLLVWSLIDQDSLVELFKWLGKQTGNVLEQVFGFPVLIGIGAVAVGVILVSRGK